MISVTFPKNPVYVGEDAFEGTSLDPNSMSWPVPIIKTEWKKLSLPKIEGLKKLNLYTRVIAWGDETSLEEKKEFVVKWDKDNKVFSAEGDDLLRLHHYKNYNDLEAAIFFYMYFSRDKIRTRGAFGLK